MPLYEYQCQACGERFEVIQKFSDGPVEICTRCGKGPVDRLLSSPAIQFKGTGWYITDYAKKSSTESTSAGKSAGSGETKSDSSSTEATKSDTASTSSPGKETASTNTKK
jgi:putative FmdB family regulatory protein